MSLAISHDSYDDFRVCVKRVESRLRTLDSLLAGETDMWYERVNIHTIIFVARDFFFRYRSLFSKVRK